MLDFYVDIWLPAMKSLGKSRNHDGTVRESPEKVAHCSLRRSIDLDSIESGSRNIGLIPSSAK
jgi:hypothetical protein